MDSHEPLYADEGFIYMNGKIAGKKSSFYFMQDGLHVYNAGFGRDMGRSLGLVGAVVGAAVDGAVSNKATANGPRMSVPYVGITEVGIHKSLLNGKGIMFTLKDGSKFKIATPNLSYKFKERYAAIANIVKTGNPSAHVAQL